MSSAFDSGGAARAAVKAAAQAAAQSKVSQR